jgi:hypothetical protein
MFTRLRNAPNLDPRWSGRVRFGPYLLVPIIILLFLYAFVTLIALIYAGTHPSHMITDSILNVDGQGYHDIEIYVNGGAGGLFGFGARSAT